MGAAKLYLSAINGIGEDDVRLSREDLFQKKDYEVLREKVGPVDGTDHIGGNYAAALNFGLVYPI